MTKILSIIVTYNAMHWIDRCVKSLMSASARSDVLIIDNGSTDGTQARISSEYPSVRFIRNLTNLGFGAANNIGFRIARDEGYDYVYLINQDAWVEKDTLKILLDTMRPEYGILSPVQRAANGKLDKQFSKKCGSMLKQAGKLVSADRVIVNVPFVMAAHWLVSRKAFLAVGGFSPAFRQYGEDDNYIHRLFYHGFKCGVVPSAGAVHDRAERKSDKTRRMNLKCVSADVRLSNPNKAFLRQSVVVFFNLLAMSLKNFSLIPLRYMATIRARRSELKFYRNESKSKGAFL